MNEIKIDLVKESLYESEKLVRLKQEFPDGIEDTNYFIYNETGWTNYFNKHYDSVTAADIPPELIPPFDNSYTDDESAREKYEAWHAYDMEGLSLKEMLTLNTKDIELQGQIEPKDLGSILSGNKNNIIIISPPDSGKTSRTILHLLSLKQRFIFLVPLVLQVDQLHIDYKDGKFNIENHDEISIGFYHSEMK